MASPPPEIIAAVAPIRCTRLNTIFMTGSEDAKADGDGPRRLFTGGADMIGYLLFLLLIVVVLGIKVKIIIGPP
jgi:hypothetical protein